MIPVWLRIWKYLNKKETVESVSEIMRDLSISPSRAYHSIKFLEELELIQTIATAKGTTITINHKFFSTRKVFEDIYKTYEQR